MVKNRERVLRTRLIYPEEEIPMLDNSNFERVSWIRRPFYVLEKSNSGKYEIATAQSETNRASKALQVMRLGSIIPVRTDPRLNSFHIHLQKKWL